MTVVPKLDVFNDFVGLGLTGDDVAAAVAVTVAAATAGT